MKYQGVLYIDKKGREILHVPQIFVVKNYVRKEPEVILDLKRLGLWFRNWQEGKVSLQKIIGYLEISSEDVSNIVGLIFDKKVAEAKSYCVDVFDDVANRDCGINSESRRRYRG